MTTEFSLSYQIRGGKYPRRMSLNHRYWQRLSHSPARCNDSLSNDLPWAWEPMDREREPCEILRAKHPSAMFIAETWADEARLEHILSTTKSLINSDSIVEATFMDFKELLSWMIRTKQNKKSFSVMFWILGTHRNRVRTNQPCYIPKQLVNVANEILLKFQAVQQPP